MNLKVFLFIFLAPKISSLDLGSLENVQEIVQFITELADSKDEEKIRAAGASIDELTVDGLRDFVQVFRKYFAEQPHETITDQELYQLEILIGRIDDMWKDETQRQLLDTLSGVLRDLNSFYVRNANNALGFLSRVNSDTRPWCREDNTNRQIRIRKLHQILVLTELRGFVLAIKASEDPRKSAARAIFHSAQYVVTSYYGILGSLKSKTYCEPPKHIRGETFSEFLELFQGLILNERQSDLYDDGKCRNHCVGLENTRINKCYNETIEGKEVPRCYIKPCNGELIECYSGGNLKACELNEESDRRFSWLKNTQKNMEYVDSFGPCNGRIVNFELQVSSTGMAWCDTCMCVCAEIDGNSKAIRTLSLLPQVTDISRSMVMTGVRFVEKDRMFHIQIEQAQLVANGQILPGTEQWLELGDFEYDPKGEGTFRNKKDHGFVQLTEWQDFSFLALDQRTFNLDQLLADEGQVLVGARFVVNSLEDAFELQVLSWPVDLRAGKLAEQSQGRWISSRNARRWHPNYNRPRSESEVGISWKPEIAPGPNLPVSEPNQKLLVRATAFSVMAQQTIPYLDLQPLTWTNGRVPLEGLELVYSRVQYYGGYLNFKIYGFDFSGELGWKLHRSTFEKFRPFYEGTLERPEIF